MKKRAVITGLGSITALGEGSDALWNALVENRSGIDIISFDSNGGWKGLGARVPGFVPEKYVPQKKALKVMARDIQLAVAGASLAMTDAGIAPVTLPDRAGVIVGAGVLNHELDELAFSIHSSLGEGGQLDMKRFGSEGLASLFPLWLLKYLPNMPACHISIIFNLQGLSNTLTTGPSAGLQAVGEALRIIQRGDADVMLAGGAESKLNPVGLSQYKALGVLAETNGHPHAVYRPFDAQSGGLVVGEGAGFIVVEELEHARKRNAKIYAEIIGYGCSSNSGQQIAIEAALADAGITSHDLQYLQACGLGLPAEDRSEMQAIQHVFNGSRQNLYVGVSKPAVGFTGFASGALDLVISTLALKKQTVPPSMNLRPDKSEMGFKVASNGPLKNKMGHAMTNAFGFNGQSVSLITKTYEDA